MRAAPLGRPVTVAAHHTAAPAEAAPDVFLREPPGADADGYVSACVAACAAWSADVFWPGRELARVAERVGEFESGGTRVLLAASAHVADLLDDKARFAEAARALGVPAPRSVVFDSVEGFEAAREALLAGGAGRVCFKPVRGVFGRGFRVVRDDLDPFEELFEEPGHRVDLADARRRFASRPRFRPMVLMPWLDGPEWSVDCFRSGDGARFVAVPRRKLSAAAQRLDDAPRLVAWSRAMAERFNLRGLFNCQFKEHRGEAHALEINPRPAGAVGLSRHAGVDLVALALRDALGLPLDDVAPRLGVTLRACTAWGDATFAAPAVQDAGDPAAPIVAELPTGRVEVVDEGGAWPARSLLDVAARTNAARGYLLVSRVLGKHLPVAPSRMQRAHDALASLVAADLPGPVAFVGMAETATGLGWGVFEAYQRLTRRDDLVCLHTTRHPVAGHELLAFEERHSHGPAQVLCAPGDTPAGGLWRAARSLVVVDDEVTTGLTAAALADRVARAGVPLERRVMATLVTSGRDELAPLAGWSVAVLGRVRVRFTPSGEAPAVTAPQGLSPLASGVGARAWGRVGAIAAPALPKDVLDRVDARCRGAARVHVVGAGELMHPAFVLARALEARGHVAFVQATTRSPVRVGAAIEATLACEDGLGSEAPFFLHNPPARGAAVVALHEPGAVGQRALAESRGAMLLEVWDA
ncbi:MAG: phosphoribosyltransferase domain-containing protein [Polyangiales bacterium]